MIHAEHSGFRLLRHDSGDRAAVSEFIRAKFLKDHGAQLEQLMPSLFSLRRPTGEIVAAFGLRGATLERLFMERYLDEPVERRLTYLSGREVARESIIEVGNLAAVPGGARAMISALTQHLHEAGAEWVAFTGVLALRHAFWRLGLRPLTLTAATPDRLSHTERALWGRYFDSQPMVMAGNVPHGYRVLMQRRARAWQSALDVEPSGILAS
jgi:hypothetical protein